MWAGKLRSLSVPSGPVSAPRMTTIPATQQTVRRQGQPRARLRKTAHPYPARPTTLSVMARMSVSRAGVLVFTHLTRPRGCGRSARYRR